MPSESPITREITQLLRRWKEGDREILSQLVSVAFDDLHAIAEGYLRRERATHSLQATALVNELYLRLVQVRGAQITDRKHFYTFAAQVMRLILVDHARRSRARKRPGSGARMPLHEEVAWINAADEELLALHTALDELEALDERKVRVLDSDTSSVAQTRRPLSSWEFLMQPSSATSVLPKLGSTTALRA